MRGAEYDVYSAGDLEKELAVLRPGHCIVDFRNTRYIDSMCISALIRALKRLREENPESTLALRNLTGGIRHVFESTKLDRLFQLERR